MIQYSRGGAPEPEAGLRGKPGAPMERIGSRCAGESALVGRARESARSSGEIVAGLKGGIHPLRDHPVGAAR